MPLYLILLGIPAATVTLWAICACVVGARAEAADDLAHQVAHGDVIRLPVGATPEALRNPSHPAPITAAGEATAKLRRLGGERGAGANRGQDTLTGQHGGGAPRA